MSCVYTCESFSSNCESLILTISQSFCINVSPIGRTVVVLYYCHVINNDNVEFLIAILMVVSKSNLELFFHFVPLARVEQLSFQGPY